MLEQGAEEYARREQLQHMMKTDPDPRECAMPNERA